MATQTGDDIGFQRNGDQNQRTTSAAVEEREHCVEIGARQPSRVIHFSDGTVEEFSDEDQPDNVNAASGGEQIDEVRSSQKSHASRPRSNSDHTQVVRSIPRASSIGDLGCG